MEKVGLVIIGAGVAGLAAGTRLLEKGFSDFLIVEANNRIGGRVHSIPFGKGIIDLGAEWVHGETGNVVFNMAEPYSLLYKSSDLFHLSELYFPDGTIVNRQVFKDIMDIYDDIMDNKLDEMKTSKGSLGLFFEERFWPRVTPIINSSKVTKQQVQNFFVWLEQVQNSIDGSPSWYETSVSEGYEYVKCPGDVLITWKVGGYNTVIDLLMKNIPNPSKKLLLESKIVLEKEVKKVEWDSNVTLHFADGSKITADRVLCTVSLAVLKRFASQLFQPALPSLKVRAIENLGIGTVDKILLEFPYRWLPAGLGGVSFVWTDEDRAAVPENLRWSTYIIGFYLSDNQPLTVLCGWVVGKAAEQMEKATDDEVKNISMNLLRRFTKCEIPEAVSFCRSMWHSSPFTAGSYSCRMVSSDKENVWPKDLAAPVNNSAGKPVLLFGGEATHDKFFSTVHGAIESGWREADRILSLTSNKSRHTVAIIGAGIAGLAAARSLVSAGVDVVILEANNYAGGRARSIKTDHGILELGAQWVHGENSTLAAFIGSRDLLAPETSSEGLGCYYRLDGSIIPENTVQEISALIHQILKDCENLVSAQNNAESIGKVIDSRFESHLRETKNKDLTWKKDLLHWHKKFQLIDNACDSLNNLSAKYWGLYEDCGENHYLNIRGCFGSLIDAFLEELPDSILHLNEPVRKIKWIANQNGCARSPRVQISSDRSEYLVDHVIVTSSLGYLKKHHNTLFAPLLPPIHREAIDAMGFGNICKLFLIYENPWWEENERGFQMVWSKDDELNNRVPWAEGLTGFDVVLNRPMLMGWIGGKSTSFVETLEETEIAQQSTYLLRRFTGRQSIPQPIKIYRSQWSRNEYTLGSYSHLTLACEIPGINGSSLAQPVYTEIAGGHDSPTILLAGEACHKTNYSTVHGAYESGVTQAGCIVKYINKVNSPRSSL